MRHLLPLLFLLCATSAGLSHAEETFALTSATYSGAEGTTVVVTVVRSGASGMTTADVVFGTMDITATSDGTLPGTSMDPDYTENSGTLHFLAGETSKTINVELLSDSSNEANETLIVYLMNPPSLGTLIEPSSAVITITDAPKASWSVGATIISPVPVSLSFSEPVSGLSVGDITLVNGTVSGLSITSPTTASVLVTPTTQGLVTATLKANSAQDADGHGNIETVANFIYDSVPPVCTVQSTTPVTTNQVIMFSAMFDEDVIAPIDTNKVTVTNGTITNIIGGPGSIGGDPRSWDIEVTAIKTGPVTLTFEPGAVSDLHGNAMSVSASDTVSYTDIIDPTVLSMGSNSPNGRYGWGSRIRLHLNFSEPVTLTGGNLLVTLNSGESISIPPFTSKTFIETIYIPSAITAIAVADLDNAGGITLSLGATLRDLSDNPIIPEIPSIADLGATKDLELVAANAPTITLCSSSTDSGSYKEGDLINVTATFSEPVRFLSSSLIPGVPSDSFFRVGLNSGGVASHMYSGIDASDYFEFLAMNYTVALGHSTPKLDANEIILHESDVIVNSAGIRLVTELPATNISSTKTILIDADPPGVIVTSVAPDPTSALSIPVVVTFTEPVTGFQASDITTNGTVSDFAGSGSSYTFTLGLVELAQTDVTIAGSVASDALGNPNMPLRAMDAFHRTHQKVPPTTPPAVSSGGSGSSSCGVGSGIASLTFGLFSLFAATLRQRRSPRHD